MESATEELNEEMAAGEEVKIKRTKGENVKEISTLSRTTSMDGGKGANEKVYVTDGTLKAPTIEMLQEKLDDLKKDSSVEARARSLLEEGPKNASEANTFQQIKVELESGNTAALEQLLEGLPQGGPIAKIESKSLDDYLHDYMNDVYDLQDIKTKLGSDASKLLRDIWNNQPEEWENTNSKDFDKLGDVIEDWADELGANTPW